MTAAERIGRYAVMRHEDLERVERTTESLKRAVREAVADGMSEVEAARVAGVTRPTIRSWLGKDKR